MARILVVSPTPSHPQDAGNRARIYALLSALKRAGHWIGYVFVEMEQGDNAAMAAAWDYFTVIPYRRPGVRRSKRWYDALMSSLGLNRLAPYQIDDWYDESVSDRVREVNRRIRPNVILLEYAYLSKALEVIGDDCYKIIDTHDVLSDRHKLFYGSSLKPMWFYTTAHGEKTALDRADCVLAIQQEETGYFSGLTRRRVLTVGHLVEIDMTERSRVTKDRLLFVGSENPINVHALNWFISEVFPLIKTHFPDIRLDVVGGCAQKITPSEGVIAVGPVSDLASWYRKATVVVNPVQMGTGLKIKAIEALAMGCPMVTTRIGAAGLQDGHGEAFLVADTPIDFSDAILTILSSNSLQSSMSGKARLYAAAYNRLAIKPLLELLDEALPGSSS